MTVPMNANLTGCRSCDSKHLTTFLRLGTLPLSGHLLRAEDLDKQEPRYPLDVALCAECSLVQILYTVPPEEVFATEYPYYSSVSPTWVAHCKRNVDALVKRFTLGVNHFAVEIASNDGYLLQHFLPHGVKVLGIDPAAGPVEKARAIGVPTLLGFFTEQVSNVVMAAHGLADVVLGNNVLAHVADTNGFVAGVAALLKDTGVAVFEFPHVMQLIERCEFDTIYHEHLCYYSLTSLFPLFARHGLTIFDVEQLPTHGGSLRIYADRNCRPTTKAVQNLWAEEQVRGLNHLGYYRDFAARVKDVQTKLHTFLSAERIAGRRVVAYGAAAKGGTMLNSTGITTSLLDYVVDKSPFKQGRYMTGSRLPVYHPSKLMEDKPDYALLLTWNFKDEILEQQAEYRTRGGRFVLPVGLEVI